MTATESKPRDAKNRMNLDLARAGKPPRRLRKLLKNLSPDPDPETVHELRTQTRRLEAVLDALSPRNTAARIAGADRRILKLLKPIRRAAGRVRDMDVLIGKASSLSSRMQAAGITRLIEHMTEIRREDLERLDRCITRRRKEARTCLKRLLRSFEDLRAPDNSAVPSGLAPPTILAQKLDQWPRLTPENLHEFRKGVKQLRYMLQLVPGQDHRLNAYAKVNEAAGDWHDWLELKCIAESILHPTVDAPVLREIRNVLQQKLNSALSAANSLRKRGIELPRAA